MTDPTGKREKAIEEAADRRVQRLLSLDKVLNRPLFSKTGLSEEEKQQDWVARLSNPEVTIQEIQQRAQAVGLARATLEFLQYADSFSGNAQES